MSQELRRKVLWLVVSSAALAAVPAISTHPAGAAAVKGLQWWISHRQEQNKPVIPFRADVAPVTAAQVYDDGIRFTGASVNCPRNAHCECAGGCQWPDCDCGWWDRGPVRRGVRRVGRAIAAVGRFLLPPYRRC